MVGIFGILLALASLMYLAYRGLNVLFIAPLMALMACLFHPGTPLLASYTQIFMPALGQYLLQYFPIFALGAIFGRVMNDSGAAYSIARFITQRLGAKHAILSVVLACALLTYGGVSLFVVAFTVYPIAISLFQRANCPRRLIPAAIALGSFTFTMTALPGTPAIQNAIPMPVFGTTAFAAPLIGCVASAVMFVSGMMWLRRREAQARVSGEGFDADNALVETAKVPTRSPSFAAAILPLVLVVVLNYMFSKIMFPAFDTTYLADAKFGASTLTKVLGTWSLVTSLAIALVVAMILYRSYFTDLVKVINEGTFDALPHNGAVITLLTICGLTHRKSYFDIFITCVVGTSIANVIAVTMGVILY